MAKQFRKIQPGANSPVSSAAATYPTGATIGVPLELCPNVSEFKASLRITRTLVIIRLRVK